LIHSLDRDVVKLKFCISNPNWKHTHLFPSWSALIRSHTAMNIACDVSFRPFFLPIMLLLLMLFDSSWYILWPPPAVDIVVPTANNSSDVYETFPNNSIFVRCKSRLFNIHVNHESCRYISLQISPQAAWIFCNMTGEKSSAEGKKGS
jgi:hypothetical protein